jgi:hypothetical protein
VLRHPANNLVALLYVSPCPWWAFIGAIPYTAKFITSCVIFRYNYQENRFRDRFPDVGGGSTDVGGGFRDVGGGSTDVGGGSTDVGGGFRDVGGGFPVVGGGIPIVGGGSTVVGCGSLSLVISSGAEKYARPGVWGRCPRLACVRGRFAIDSGPHACTVISLHSASLRSR